MADSPYRIPLAQFERETPRVHARPVDPEDPDGEMTPSTAFAGVEQPDPPPNPNLIEGMILGIGRIGSATTGGTVNHRAQVSIRLVIAIVAMPFVIFGLVTLFHLL